MKKTIILILAAMMTVSLSAAAISVSEPAVLTQEKKAKKSPKQKAALQEVTFHVHLHCENCVKKTEENIAFEKGVKDLKVTMADQTVAIKYDPSKTSEEVLKAAIEKLGYEVYGKLEPGQKPAHDGHHHHHAH